MENVLQETNLENLAGGKTYFIFKTLCHSTCSSMVLLAFS